MIDRLSRGALGVGERHEIDNGDIRTTDRRRHFYQGTCKAGTYFSPLNTFVSFPPLHHAYSQEGHRRGWTALFLERRGLLCWNGAFHRSERAGKLKRLLEMRDYRKEKRQEGT